MGLLDTLRAIWRRAKEDVLVVSFTLLLIGSIFYLSTMVLGWLKLIQLSNINKGLASRAWVDTAPDSDNDQLPDLMEMTPFGQPVSPPGLGVIGTGTGTNPYNPDSDFDGFPDNAEIKLGSDPNNFFDPGFLWILWGIFFAFVIYKLFIEKPDRLRDYKLNEASISGGGVAGKKGKFAYGSANVFSKPVSEMSAEEKREIIESDPRLTDLSDLEELPPPEKKGMSPVVKTLVQFVVITIVVTGVWLIIRP